MKIFIDADACPVVGEAVSIAEKYGVECVIVCDASHEIEREGARTVTVLEGADSADFALVNMLAPGDIVVTQDYGLAAMALAKGARALNQDGRPYCDRNIDGLLSARHVAKKIRSAGGRLKGLPKRKAKQDKAFAASIERLIREDDL